MSSAKNSIQQIYGQPVTPEIEKLLNLRKSTLENMINTALIRQEAKKMGIKVSDDELVAAIAKMPYFQKDGAFDKKLYDQLLQTNHLTPTGFESGVRDDLTIAKAGKTVADKVTLTDQDLLQYFKKTNDKIELQYVSFSPAEVRNSVKATDQELNAYLQQHEKEFKTQEEIKLDYVLLNPAKLLPALTVSTDEIQTYYQKNIDRYQGKGGILPFEEVKIRQKRTRSSLRRQNNPMKRSPLPSTRIWQPMISPQPPACSICRLPKQLSLPCRPLRRHWQENLTSSKRLLPRNRENWADRSKPRKASTFSR